MDLDTNPLIRASMDGDMAKVQELLASGANLDTVDEEGYTSLHYASVIGHVDIVRLLIAKGANPDTTNIHGVTPLHHASFSGNTVIAQLLIEKGADVNVADLWIDNTPLHAASEKGHVDMARLLIEKGADVNAVNSARKTPLINASEKGHVDIVRLLIAKGADPGAANEYGITPLHWASAGGHVDIVRLLIAKGADPSAANMGDVTPLHWARCPWRRTDPMAVVSVLLAAGAVPRKGVPALHHRIIVAVAAKPFALRPGESSATALCERDMYGRTALHYAALKENYDAWTTLKYAMDKADVDTSVKDNGGMTPSNYMVSGVLYLLTSKLTLYFCRNWQDGGVTGPCCVC
jgi:ankyrin